MKMVVLVSGGMDSFLTLALAARKDNIIYPMAFRYGQRHEIELEYAKQHIDYARGLGYATVHDLHVVTIENLFHTKLAGNLDAQGTWVSAEQEDQAYLPNRNAVMAMVAASYAERLEANEVHMGLITSHSQNKTAAIMSDTSPAFVQAVNKLLAISTRDVEVEVVAPIIDKSKEDVIRLGRKLGVPILNSWSCFDPQGDLVKPHPCGKCPPCVSRAVAIAAIGIRGAQ